MRPELNKIFKPAFLGRMVLIPYYPIREESLKLIMRLKLAKIQKRIDENHKIRLTFDPALVDTVASRCTEVESGARNVDNILDQHPSPGYLPAIVGANGRGREGLKYPRRHRSRWGVCLQLESSGG